MSSSQQPPPQGGNTGSFYEYQQQQQQQPYGQQQHNQQPIGGPNMGFGMNMGGGPQLQQQYQGDFSMGGGGAANPNAQQAYGNPQQQQQQQQNVSGQQQFGQSFGQPLGVPFQPTSNSYSNQQSINEQQSVLGTSFPQQQHGFGALQSDSNGQGFGQAYPQQQQQSNLGAIGQNKVHAQNQYSQEVPIGSLNVHSTGSSQQASFQSSVPKNSGIWPGSLGGGASFDGESGGHQAQQHRAPSLNNPGVIGHQKPTPPTSQPGPFHHNLQGQQGGTSYQNLNSSFGSVQSQNHNASPVSMREHGQFQAGSYQPQSHFSQNTSQQSSKRNSQNSPSAFPTSYMQGGRPTGRDQVTASPGSATSPRHHNTRIGDSGSVQGGSPKAFKRQSPATIGRFVSPQLHHSSPLGGDKGSSTGGERLGSSGRGSVRGGNKPFYSETSPTSEDNHARGGVVLESMLPPSQQQGGRPKSFIDTQNLSPLQVDDRNERQQGGNSSNTISLDRIAREHSVLASMGKSGGALTPLPHPAPPPAPSAPPTASTPGADYHSFWADRKSWGAPLSSKDRWHSGDLSDDGTDVAEVEEEDDREVLGGINLMDAPSRSDDVTPSQHVTVEEAPASDDDNEGEEEGPIPAEYRPTKKAYNAGDAPSNSGSTRDGDDNAPQMRQVPGGSILPNQQDKYASNNKSGGQSQQSLHSSKFVSIDDNPSHIPSHNIGGSSSPIPEFVGLGISASHGKTGGLPLAPRHAEVDVEVARENVMRGQWLGPTSAVTVSSTNLAGPVGQQDVGIHPFPPGQQQSQQQQQTLSQPPSLSQASSRQQSQDWAHVSPSSSSSYGVTSFSSTHSTLQGSAQTINAFPSREDQRTPLSVAQSPDKEDETENTNPSAAGTPEPVFIPPKIAAIPSPSMKMNVSSEDGLMVSLRALYGVLPETHITSLHNYALFLSEDSKLAERAQHYVDQGANPWSDDDGRLTRIGEERLQKWMEWSEFEESERRRLIGVLSPRSVSIGGGSGRASGASGSSFVKVGKHNSYSPFAHGKPTPTATPNIGRDYIYEAETETNASGDEGSMMYPLPPPKKSSVSFTPVPIIHKQKKVPRQVIRPFEVEESPNPQLHEHSRTPPEAPEPPRGTSPSEADNQSPTRGTFEIELQMPRPMPGVPANRIDPSARARLTGDDDAQTVTDGEPGQGSKDNYTSRSAYDSAEFKEQAPPDTKSLNRLCDGFLAQEEDVIPQFLKHAYNALRTATHSPSLEMYLTDAKKQLDSKITRIQLQYQEEAVARRQKSQTETNMLYSQGHVTVADIERLRNEFERSETQRRLTAEKKIYYIFENEFVEVAYKDVKGQLEILGGKWYEEVKSWLMTTAVPNAGNSETNLTQLTLIIEAISLINGLHLSMEDHEHHLHNLVSERNSKYLQVSVSPLLAVGDSMRAADAERRFWVDEQDRQIVGRIDALKRTKEHLQAVQQIVQDLIPSLRKKCDEFVDGINNVILQLPRDVLRSPLFQAFLENAGDAQTGALPELEKPIPIDVVDTIMKACGCIQELLQLVAKSLDCEYQPQIRVAENSVKTAVVENHAQAHGVTSPAVIQAAISQGLAQKYPQVLKRLKDGQNQRMNEVITPIAEPLTRFGALLESLKKGVARLQHQAALQAQQQAQQQTQQAQQAQQAQQQAAQQQAQQAAQQQIYTNEKIADWATNSWSYMAQAQQSVQHQQQQQQQPQQQQLYNQFYQQIPQTQSLGLNIGGVPAQNQPIHMAGMIGVRGVGNSQPTFAPSHFHLLQNQSPSASSSTSAPQAAPQSTAGGSNASSAPFKRNTPPHPLVQQLVAISTEGSATSPSSSQTTSGPRKALPPPLALPRAGSLSQSYHPAQLLQQQTANFPGPTPFLNQVLPNQIPIKTNTANSGGSGGTGGGAAVPHHQHSGLMGNGVPLRNVYTPGLPNLGMGLGVGVGLGAEGRERGWGY